MKGVAMQSTDVGQTTRNVACNATRPVTSLTEDEGHALGVKARAAYKKSTGKKLGELAYVRRCSLDSPTQLGCSFDAPGRGDGDEPFLLATFKIVNGTVGDVVSTDYNP
jgi:hypothetical protein